MALDGGKVDFVNLRNASVTDVLLANCLIEELDLRGATIDAGQLSLLAPLLAGHLGLVVR